MQVSTSPLPVASTMLLAALVPGAAHAAAVNQTEFPSSAITLRSTELAFTAGTDTTPGVYARDTTGATQAAAGGNPGNHLSWGGSTSLHYVVAAPSAATVWRVEFDFKNPDNWWIDPNFAVIGLQAGERLNSVYWGNAAGLADANHVNGTPLLIVGDRESGKAGLGNNAEWKRFSFDVSVPAGLSVVALEWWGDFSGPARLDNLVVTAVPEPASLALLSLGGAALLRRRG